MRCGSRFLYYNTACASVHSTKRGLLKLNFFYYYIFKKKKNYGLTLFNSKRKSTVVFIVSLKDLLALYLFSCIIMAFALGSNL